MRHQFSAFSLQEVVLNQNMQCNNKLINKNKVTMILCVKYPRCQLKKKIMIQQINQTTVYSSNKFQPDNLTNKYVKEKQETLK